jgi:hypothetical protein
MDRLVFKETSRPELLKNLTKSMAKPLLISGSPPEITIEKIPASTIFSAKT